MSRPRQVIMYELNEVPWEIMDLYIKSHPRSNLAQLLGRSSLYTTVNDDEAGLSPWRTWPTLHKSLYTRDHNSYELGQDPETFRGVDLWTALDEAGYVVGLFGALQSWPPHQFKSGGFFVPDTFARDESAVPRKLERFQRFNLKMTSENSFSSDVALRASELPYTALDLVRQGLRPRSAARLSAHLLRERWDSRYKAARPMMQVVPSFDLFFRLLTQEKPHFSIFFTNHVASMMHRYWGDAVPGYAEEYSYKVDEVYGTFVSAAMDLADAQIGQLADRLSSSADARLIVAASMGQGPIQHRPDMGGLLHLRDGKKLAARLGFPDAEMRLAMFPMCSLEFSSEDAATSAGESLRAFYDSNGRVIFEDIESRGQTLTFRTRKDPIQPETSTEIFFGSGVREPTGSLAEIGIEIEERLGGDNTAYHIPEGILIDFCPTEAFDLAQARARISVLDVAPSLLANAFGVEPPSTMRGSVEAGLFAWTKDRLVSS